MEVDLDNFDDDIFAGVAAKNNNARAGGRFHPRAKRGPVKKQPAAASRSSSQSCVDNAPNVAARSEESSKPHEDKCAEVLNPLEHVTTQEKVDHTAESLAETGQHSGLENSFGENADIACPHSTTEAPAIPVFQSPEDGFAPAVISCPLVLDSSSSGSTFILSKKGRDIVCPESSPIEDPLAGCPESPLNEDPLTGGHPIVSVSEGSSLMHDGRSVIKQVESYPCLESLDTPDITSYGPRIGKFQPKPKIHEARSKVCTPNPEVGKSGVCENQHLDPSEFQNTISECHEDDVLDLSSLGFDNSLPLEPAFQQPAQDMSLEQPAQDEGNAEAVCDMHESMGTREAKGDQPSTSTSSQLSRPHRKCNNGSKLVDESEDEEPNEISVDPGELVGHHGDDKELQVNNKSQEKKKPRKRSNKPVVDKEKPVRKRKKVGEATNQDTGTNRKFGEATNQNTTNKKAGEATNQDTGTKSKKFPHSTRQRKRRVDQTLLETPEDLIEYQKVPMRDLIILADYKERMTKKTATTSQVPPTGESMGSTSTQNNDYEGIPSEGVEVPMEALFNYHTYMEKTPRAKWLEQDTELFYQGIRQFGTDLSMIQQLFPGLTRNQIKSKYKKEEKQHPLRLREALTNRPNDFSHFQQVIANMKKVAAENQQTDGKDESVDLVDDEDTEPISETIDEAAKAEQQMEQGEGEDLPAEVPVKSPPVSYESEDDLDFDWSQYNSEV